MVLNALFLTLFLPKTSWGYIYFEDAIFPELATSARALAMGNAYVAKADDSAAVFYNPSGLGTVRRPHLHLSNIHLETNKDWLDLGAGGKLTDAGSNLGKSFSLEGTRQLLLESRGKVSHSRFHVLPNFTARFISMGYLYSKRTKATMGPETNAPFEYAQRTDHGPYLSLNLSLFGGVIKVGATGIYQYRQESIGEAPGNQSFELNEDNTNKGHMLNVTAGGKITLPVALLPTFAATLHNSTSAYFTHDSGPRAPDKIRPTLDVGFSLTPKIGGNSAVHFEFNFKDLGNQYPDVSSTRKALFGLEFDFGRLMFFRLGYGDGFGSAGLGLKSQRVELDLTTYAVDTTTNGFRGKEDRRFAFSLSTGF